LTATENLPGGSAEASHRVVFHVTPQVKYCPPAAAHSTIAPEPVFHGRDQHPVTAEMGSDGEMVSPYGISFDDYSRMQTTTKASTYRYKPVPVYATDPDAMRRLLVRFMEMRAFGLSRACKRGPLPGTDAYRLRRAHMKLLDDVPRLDALANDLCRRFVEGKQNGADPAWLKKMEIEIEGVDSLMIVAKDTPNIVVGVIWRSYCLNEDSVTVGERLGLKPPSVRALLSRLAKTWARMQIENAGPGAAGRLPKLSPERLEQRRKSSATWYASLSEEERSARMGRSVARRRAARVTRQA
jgi:hypothetical protein